MPASQSAGTITLRGCRQVETSRFGTELQRDLSRNILTVAFHLIAL